MALDAAVYLVSLGIATRSGLLKSRYRTADGRFILDKNDLARVRLNSDEYITGLQGVEKTTQAEAEKLIKANGFKMGLTDMPTLGDASNTTASGRTDADVNTTDNDNVSEETIGGNDVGKVEDVVNPDNTEVEDNAEVDAPSDTENGAEAEADKTETEE